MAEVDLELRGEGTIMNTAQKGRSDLKLASLRRDRDLIESARAAATEIIGNDPTLKSHNEIPERERTAKGIPIVNLLPLQNGETIQAIIDTRRISRCHTS